MMPLSEIEHVGKDAIGRPNEKLVMNPMQKLGRLLAIFGVGVFCAIPVWDKLVMVQEQQEHDSRKAFAERLDRALSYSDSALGRKSPPKKEMPDEPDLKGCKTQLQVMGVVGGVLCLLGISLWATGATLRRQNCPTQSTSSGGVQEKNESRA